MSDLNLWVFSISVVSDSIINATVYVSDQNLTQIIETVKLFKR